MTRASGTEEGTLWIVATPVGNLADLSPRARDLLETVPVIAAEDTRVSRRLLSGRRDEPRWISLNEHSEARHLAGLIELLRSGIDVALVSDAGTPLISDPGYRLVDAAHDAGIRVSPLPGPCAAIAALSAAGLPSDRFWFEGFLPARAPGRRRRLQALASTPATVIAYVPARALVEVLEDCVLVLGGERPAALARELTKIHETVRRGRLDELQAFCRDDADQARGEAVLLIAGSDQPARAVDALALAVELAPELPPSRAARILSRLTGLSRKQAWELIEQQREPGSHGASVTRDE